MKYIYAALLASFSLSACPLWAETFARIKDEQAFLKLVKGRDLRIGLYDLTLTLAVDGRIIGSALGWGITGSWRWDNSYFCRAMDWSGYAIEDNCQLVEALGTEKLRFTTDQGAGDSATFRLR